MITLIKIVQILFKKIEVKVPKKPKISMNIELVIKTENTSPNTCALVTPEKQKTNNMNSEETTPKNKQNDM
jgi:hypothetical protein